MKPCRNLIYCQPLLFEFTAEETILCLKIWNPIIRIYSLAIDLLYKCVWEGIFFFIVSFFSKIFLQLNYIGNVLVKKEMSCDLGNYGYVVFYKKVSFFCCLSVVFAELMLKLERRFSSMEPVEGWEASWLFLKVQEGPKQTRQLRFWSEKHPSSHFKATRDSSLNYFCYLLFRPLIFIYLFYKNIVKSKWVSGIMVHKHNYSTCQCSKGAEKTRQGKLYV